ncbi:MAG TPA: leucine--tRNA ligase [Bacteroidota bacterium]|nr:leucine--tRNA ligase [Bacteroidota bacterium]
MKYSFKDIEEKWQKFWEEKKINEPDLRNAKNPFYNLMMFPYPSAEGLHVGNLYAFTGSDIYGRFKRMQGYDVFEPIGFDAFGIHSENYAIKTKRHPSKLIPQNIANFTRQLKKCGLMFDWSHVVDTTDPKYYKWTQWIFLQLYKAGLVYRKKSPVNWCPECKTVLADEQVIGGKCERHSDTEVEKRELEQWFFKITQYADKLYENLKWIDWSQNTKTAQELWIGKSEGAQIIFSVKGIDEKIVVFTTRPDTLFGATYMVLAPEHPLVPLLTTSDRKREVEDYVQKAIKKDQITRLDITKEKTGVFTGSYAMNPANNSEIPIWIADYVLWGYGTGAIMAVPAHDSRDFEFAKQFNLPIIEVISKTGKPSEGELELYDGEGILINSGEFNGMNSDIAKRKIVEHLNKKGIAEFKINYRLHDWCISRQRYWGPPIPMVHCDKCGILPVNENDLPVLLPETDNYLPDDSGKSPLARVESWVETTCPKCGSKARKDTDVSDNFLDSAWYFLRYPSVGIDDVPMDKEITRKWLPVDMYIGGNEHAVLHLMYTRFICMVLHDLGLIHFEEPFKRFRAHGLIIKDGNKMSKSKGNIVNPDEYIDKYGADTFRMYLMFLGPYQEGGDFRDSGIIGIHRFLEKVNSLSELNFTDETDFDDETNTILHQTIKVVTSDFESLKYNTAIARLMEFLNYIREKNITSKLIIKYFTQLLAPLAPHIAEELWNKLGYSGSVFNSKLPVYDESKIKISNVNIVIQINGKIKDRIDVPKGLDEKELEKIALENEKVKAAISNKIINKIITVKDKLVNIVVK